MVRQGNMLTITKDMVGDNEWVCLANNSIQGKFFQTSKEVKFKAGKCSMIMSKMHGTNIMRLTAKSITPEQDKNGSS